MKFLGLNITISKPNKRAYEAADKRRRGNAFRLANSTGPNREISGALVTLRNRSRHMVRNNGWAKRAVGAITKHTIGEGIQPAPVGKLSKTKTIKEAWRDWAGTTDCDWYGKMNFYGLQELAMRSIVEGGDILVLRRWTMDNESGIPLKLQLLEGDQLDHSQNGTNDKGIARMGVQYNKEGQITGYWLFDYHPGDGSSFAIKNESHFVGKENVLHVFEVLRIGQSRGLPFGVAGFMKMSDFSDYEDAQLMKQKLAACFAAFVVDGDMTTPNNNKDLLEHLEPGIIEHLNTGDTVEFANPPSVADYDNYSTRILQGIAAAYEITYEMLTMDYSRVNFTSGRMAKIDVTSNFRSWQYNMMVPQFCAPAWKWFVDACLVAGKIKEPVKADWTAPRVQQLDPVKETNAQIMKIKSGLATISETIRETGREPEEFFEECGQDAEKLKEFFDKYGIVFNSIEFPGITNNSKKTSNTNE
ncbi:MAG: phage portal protein [Dysgonamonadaceae bacterium]|jgi:lambda family phage portal protein|nr:phage portal protein [Dysgonamonadaceae bacterium]